MKLTTSRLRKLILEEIENVMGGDKPQSLNTSEQKFVIDNIKVEYDDYEVSPGTTADSIVNENILAPDAFIASAPEEDIDSDDDEAMYHKADYGTKELWVGEVGDVKVRSQDPKVASRYGSMNEKLKGFYVVEYYGSWHYEAGPFKSFDQAKEAGLKMAKEKGWQTAEEIDPDSVYSGERDI
jgi:hypothetical protein